MSYCIPVENEKGIKCRICKTRFIKGATLETIRECNFYGLGTLIAKFLKRIGVKPKGCCGCSKREGILNLITSWLYFTAIELWKGSWYKPSKSKRRKEIAKANKALLSSASQEDMAWKAAKEERRKVLLAEQKS